MQIDMNMLVFFLRKCFQTAAKTVVVDSKNQKALALLYLVLGLLPNAANSSVVLTEFAAELTTKMKSSLTTKIKSLKMKSSVTVIGLSLRLRLITVTSTLIILDIAKTSSNNIII